MAKKPYTTLRNLSGGASFSLEDAAEKVRAATGKSAQQQQQEIREVRNGPGKLTRQEYYIYGIYDPAFSREDRLAFRGARVNTRICQSLNPPELPNMKPLTADKLLFTLLFDRCGIPTTKTQAVFSTLRRVPGVPVLTNADEIRSFITGTACYPLFGKPGTSSMARGVISIRELSADGTKAILGNGEVRPLDDIIEDIAAIRTGNYLFQDHVRSHPDLGSDETLAVGTLRICTICEENRPRLLYAYQRFPHETSISDDATSNSRVLALMNVETGLIDQLWTGDRTFGHALEADPLHPAIRLGGPLPFWEEAATCALAAHEFVIRHGIMAWDVAITPEGPVLLEGNTVSMLVSLQSATGKGLMSGEVGQRLQAVIDRKAPAVRKARIKADPIRRRVKTFRRKLRKALGLSRR
jgi:Sugar-transfer associated ATP-grasp